MKNFFKPVSGKVRRHETWGVLRIEGSGELLCTAHDRVNAILKAAILYTNDWLVDTEAWWKENAKKKKLVLTKLVLEVPAYRAKSYPDWVARETPAEQRCEWDTGSLLEVQCRNKSKGMEQGRRLCLFHLNKHHKDGTLRLISTSDDK